MTGKKKDEETRSSLDFKVLSLDEIRAKKKTDHTPPITLNLCSRKRKLSTQESVTTTGEKIIKVVRSNSIVYKQLERNPPATSSLARLGRKISESETSRKRTISEVSDVCEIHEDELVDNCFEFKKIKIAETNQNKPRLIRNRNISENKDSDKIKEPEDLKADNDSDNEVQIVSVEVSENSVEIDLDKIYDSEIIDVDTTRIAEPVDIVDLSEDVDDDITASGLDLDLTKNVPDVVASCHRNKYSSSDKNLVNDIDVILNDDL